jgi:hypothetical protein
VEAFLVLVILRPTKKQIDDEGAQPKIVVQAQAVLAKDEGGAASKAYRLVPQEYEGMDDRLEARVLPFRTVGR